MELKDYLHYYLGCKCKTYAGKGKLTSLDIDSGHWYVSLDTGGGTVGNINDTYRECPEESKQAFPNGYPPKSILKPLLRRLEDMTEEERKQIWQLIFGSPFPSSGRELWFDKESYSACKRWVLMSGVERVGIEINGCVWADSDLHHYRFNPAMITHYLLQHGFDLFGLIPAGLAIDARTVEP